MFCAFDNPALILRLYGRGRYALAGTPGYDALAGHFPKLRGARQIFDIAVDSVQESCGWGVPHMSFDRERKTLAKFHAQQDPTERLARIAARNRSIDGLPVMAQTIIPAWDD